MPIFRLLLVFLLVFAGHSLAQGQPRNCATEEADALLRVQFPQLGDRESFENWLAEKKAENRRSSARNIFTIPVIVHVLHNGDPVGSNHNLSQAQIMSQFEVLNEDFRRLAGTPGFNTNPVGADAEIEFCPAQFDPAGQALNEPGINRIDRNTLGLTSFPWSVSYINSQVKPPTHWDPNSYLNIWLVELETPNIGYAQYPNQSGLTGIPVNDGPGSTDGVVINYYHFGRGGLVFFPYNGGRTTTHEVGHWLGLRHIWGDGGCSVDDYCDDTPEADGETLGCPSGQVSCGGPKMIENYMDYTDDGCMNLFTQCQKDRMWAVLQNSPRRVALANSTACTGATNLNDELESRLSLFPNPVKDRLILNWAEDQPPKSTRIRLLDPQGRLWQEWELRLSNEEMVLKLNRIPAGVYYLQVISGQNVYSRQVVIRS